MSFGSGFMMDVSLALLPGSRGKPKLFLHRHPLSCEPHTLTLSHTRPHTRTQRTHTLTHTYFSSHVFYLNLHHCFSACNRMSYSKCSEKYSRCKCMQPAVCVRVWVSECVCTYMTMTTLNLVCSSHTGLRGWWLSGASVCAVQRTGKLGSILTWGQLFNLNF